MILTTLDIFEEDTKLKCLEDFSFFLRFLFINLGYVEFDMSHYNHVTFQSFSLIEQSTSETISTSGHWLPAVWPPLPVALLLLVFGCCCCWYITNSSYVFTNLFHELFSKNCSQFERLKMVSCYQNCSDLLWEKIVLVIETNLLRSLEQFIQTVKGQNNSS